MKTLTRCVFATCLAALLSSCALMFDDPKAMRAERLDRHLETTEETAEVEEKLRDGWIWVGMTEKQLLVSRGMPSDINETVTEFGRSRQYVYDVGLKPGYVYVDDGVVTAWQDM